MLQDVTALIYSSNFTVRTWCCTLLACFSVVYDTSAFLFKNDSMFHLSKWGTRKFQLLTQVIRVKSVVFSIGALQKCWLASSGAIIAPLELLMVVA